MITVSPAAAEQIRESAKQGDAQGLSLRLAVTQLPDKSFHYAMGFDDTGRTNDKSFSSEGVEIIVSEANLPLLNGTLIDYVELEPAKFHFIFMNPNDPNYSPPNESQEDESTPM